VIPLWKLPALRSDALNFVTHLRDTYGDIAYIRSHLFNAALLSNPEWIRQVLVTDARRFEKSYGLKRLRKVLGDGLLTSEGDFHRRQRRMLQPAFHKNPMRQYAAPMIDYALQTRARWQDGEELRIDLEMMRLTLAIVGKTLFDSDVEGDADEVGVALGDLFEAFPRLLMPFAEALLRVPTRGNRRVLRVRRIIDETIYRVIDERRARPEQADDLMSMLLSAQDEDDGSGMSAKQARDEALTLFLAGHETTALALSWAFYLLARHPEVQTRLFAEVDAVLGPRDATFDDFERLPYTYKVIKETLRLYPPAAVLGRQALEDCRFGPYTVPGGRSMVFFSPYAMQRDPRYYDEPERFSPERWTPEFEAALPKFAYFPFGGGPRICIGEGFAWLEAVLALATLSQHWALESVGRAEVTPKFSVTLRPEGGIVMRARRRTAVASVPAPSGTVHAPGCPFHSSA
jgi:cytochrome P450